MSERLKNPILERGKFVKSKTTENSDVREAYSISDLAKEFGVTLRTLRFYEDKGILSPKRRGVTRIYSRRDKARLTLALKGKRVGFSLAEIREIIDLYDLPGGEMKQLEVSAHRIKAQIQKLQGQRQDIDAALDELRATSKDIKTRLEQR